MSPAPPAAGQRLWAWGLYAWANHAFSTSVLVGLFPIFFARYWASALPGTTSTLYLGLSNSSASLVVMLLAPWLGAWADRRAHKKRFLGIFTVLGVGATAALAACGAGDWSLALAAFWLASVGFFGGLSFHDALLLNVSTAARADRVSAFGFALGYLGGGLLFALNVAMVLKPQWFGFANSATATRAAFLSAALWWAVFALPLFLRVPEGAPTAAHNDWRALWATLRAVWREAPVRQFLLAYWLYIDAIGTLQQMAVDFGAKLGFATQTLIGALLMVQFISVPAALGFGWLAGRIGARAAIQLGLLIFVLVSGGAWFMHSERDFYVMAVAVALAQGGVQALSRSFFAGLIDAQRAGVYFGFYNMLGKFAAVLGPALVGIVAAVSGQPRLGIAVLAMLFVAGMALLARVRVPAVPA